MKLFVIHTGYGLTREEIGVRVARMKQAAAADTEIVMECLEHTDICIDSRTDIALASPEIIQKAIQAERDGYDAISVYCTSDPAVEACREVVDIPVIGAGCAMYATAMLLGKSWSFITTTASRIQEKREFARECGIDITRLQSVRSVDGDPAGGETAELRERLINIAGQCRDQDGADVVLLGCLSFAGMGPEISAAVGIPAVDPAYAIVTAAEALYRQRLSHSRKTYPNPPSRRRIWGSGMIEI